MNQTEQMGQQAEGKQRVFSDLNGFQLEFNRTPHTWKLNNTLMNNPCAKQEVAKKNFIIHRAKKNENTAH